MNELKSYIGFGRSHVRKVTSVGLMALLTTTASSLSARADTPAAGRALPAGDAENAHKAKARPTAKPGQPAASSAASAAKRKSQSALLNETGVEAIQVSGARAFAGGLMKAQRAPQAVSSVTGSLIAKLSPTSDPLALMASLPGVNFGGANGFGLSPLASFSVRGLSSSEMGWIVEGMPVQDRGSYIPQQGGYADNENIADMTLIAGSSRLHDPVPNASGGEIVESLRAPSDKREGVVDYSPGSYNSDRAFIRLDSGYLGNSGIKMFGSYSYTAADEWANPGRDYRHHVDFKATKEWGNRGTSSLYVSYGYQKNFRVMPRTLAQWEAANAQGDNFSVGSHPFTYTPGASDYYQNNALRRESVMVSFQNAFDISKSVHFHITPYFRWVDAYYNGQQIIDPNSLYVGTEKVAISQTGKFPVASTSQNPQMFGGINSYFDFDLTKTNHLTFGYWYDNSTQSTSNPLTLLSSDGLPSNAEGNNPLRTVDGRIVEGTNFNVSAQINEFYIQDTQEFFNGRLKLSAGFKEYMYHVYGNNLLPGDQQHFASSFAQPLPRVSISYDINKNMQVYVNGTTGIRPPAVSSTYANQYNVNTGAISVAGSPSQQPEYNISEELGFRYHGAFLADVSLFNMNLTNHQVMSRAHINGVDTTTSISAGGETIRGVTAQLSLRPFYGFSPYVSGQFLDARTDNNISVSGTYLPTQGKMMVQSPRFIASVGISYAKGPFFGLLTFKYTDSQYTTFMNDESIPAFKTVDLALGYHVPEWRFIHNATFKLNFSNLTNVSYLSGVDSVTFNSHPVKALNGTTIAGNSPRYYVALPLVAQGSVSIGF